MLVFVRYKRVEASKQQSDDCPRSTCCTPSSQAELTHRHPEAREAERVGFWSGTKANIMIVSVAAWQIGSWALQRS